MQSIVFSSVWLSIHGTAMQKLLLRFQKITNTVTLVDYPLFSGVVVIHSLHVSSFREAHHQEFIFSCTVSLWHSV